MEFADGTIWLDDNTVLPPLDEDEDENEEVEPWPHKPAGQQA